MFLDLSQLLVLSGQILLQLFNGQQELLVIQLLILSFLVLLVAQLSDSQGIVHIGHIGIEC
jgi:hypothetical protein